MRKATVVGPWSRSLLILALAAAPGWAAMALRGEAPKEPTADKGTVASDRAPAAKPAPAAAPSPSPAPAAPAAAAPAEPTPLKPGQLAPPKKPDLCGSIIYAQGSRLVAELKGGAMAKERFRVYEGGTRLRGEVMAVKALDEATVLMEPVGSVTVTVGDRLARIPQ